MYDVKSLHWSFNHNRKGQEEFGERLGEAIRSYTPGSESNRREDHQRCTYDILPNFWRGYNRRADAAPRKRDLGIGQVTIERKLSDVGIWQYSVHSSNTTSGEDLRIDFRCNDDAHRTICDEWRIEAENAAGNLHKRFICTGRLQAISKNSREIQLSVGSLYLAAGRHEGVTPLTTNWTLFDVIPLLDAVKTGMASSVEIALLEDMEKLKSPAYIGLLESIELGVAGDHGDTMHLTGYYLYGTGVVPSYWWVDTNSNVVIASTTFQTLVLRDARTEGGVK